MRFGSSVLALALAVGSAHGQLHGQDIVLKVEDGRVTTHDLVPGTTSELYPSRVFMENFGSSGFPGFTADPGFESLPGTFTPNLPVGLSIRRALRVWDDGAEHFDTIPAERIEINRVGVTQLTPIDDPDPGAGLPTLQLGIAGSNGRIHVHPWYTLMPPAGAGVYLLELEVWAGAFEPSEPVWIVFNQNRPADEVQRAVAWVESNLASPDCPADFNGDGVLNFFDFSMFIALYNDEDPRADLAPPFGVFNFFDVSAFISLYNQGCP
jgi:hypothetical protein